MADKLKWRTVGWRNNKYTVVWYGKDGCSVTGDGLLRFFKSIKRAKEFVTTASRSKLQPVSFVASLSSTITCKVNQHQGDFWWVVCEVSGGMFNGRVTGLEAAQAVAQDVVDHVLTQHTFTPRR